MPPKLLSAAVAVMATAALASCSGDATSATSAPSPSPSAPAPDPRCPLSGRTAPKGVSLARPAVAVKVENNPVAYPLSGLEKAEIVYEELVEGGMTRFMAMYHCTDAPKVGPVRSTRIVDPAIMSPTTRILAGAGGNDIVRAALKKARIIIIDEPNAGNAMERIDRPGVTFEHTLYGTTKPLRRLGQKRFDKPPPSDLFRFGPLKGKSRKARTVTIEFSPISTIVYKWKGGKWVRFEDGVRFVAESGRPIAVDNVLIEQHKIENSTRLFDIAGNPSTEIADVTGSGPAVLFRNGRAIKGRWVRKSPRGAVAFKTFDGTPMVLRPGSTWIELAPGKKGQIKGSFSFR